MDCGFLELNFYKLYVFLSCILKIRMIILLCILWQLRHLELVIKKHEAEVLNLEEDKVRLKRVRVICVILPAHRCIAVNEA